MTRNGRLVSVLFAGAISLASIGFAWSGCSSQDHSQFTDNPPAPAATVENDGGSGNGNGSSGSSLTSPPSGGGGSSGYVGFDFDAGPPPCSMGDAGLANCVNQKCGSSPTTLSGKVYDPAGKNPLYNVAVYVPRDPLGRIAPITLGTNSCNTCDVSIGNYVAVTTTDETGSFTLPNVPTGVNVPVVIQIGKWRREIRVTTKDCATTTIPAAVSRLPRNKTEGDMPQMALLTGGCDELPCFMRDMGIDANEFTGPANGGRLHIYQGDTGNGFSGPGPALQGGGGGTAPNCTSTNAGNCPLWTSKSALETYDIVVLSCECDTHDDTKPNKQPLHDWLDEGGKVFATHYHYTWFENGPADFQKIADWSDAGLTLMVPGPFQVDTSFPKGVSFNKWLGNVGALNANGTINLMPSDVRTSVTTVNTPTTRWIYDTSTMPQNTKYLSFGTPIGGVPVEAGTENATPQYCGKAVLTDLHAGSGNNGIGPANPIPSSCTVADMTPQEKALEFLFFDLSACVQNDMLPVVMPQTVQ